MILQCPVVERVEKTGYPNHIKPWTPKKLLYNACDVCDKYEAEVKFHNTKLCSGCCKEEGITIL